MGVILSIASFIMTIKITIDIIYISFTTIRYITERFETILSVKSNEYGDIIIDKAFKDIVNATEFIAKIKEIVINDDEISRVKEILRQDIVSELKPIEIEDDTTVYNIKSEGKEGRITI